MTERTYWATRGGHPPQTDLLTDRAMFREAYAVIPRGTQRDIVTSYLPFWEDTRLWVLARPMTGFAETFSQYLVEVAPGGGSDEPEDDPDAEAVLFVMEGSLELTLGDEPGDGDTHELAPAGTRSSRPARRGPRTTAGASTPGSCGSASATRRSRASRSRSRS